MKLDLGITLDAVSVRRGATWALQDISLQFKAGEHWALIGGNGSGKTQLLKLLATAVWPTPNGRGARHYLAAGVELDPIDAKQRIAYVGAELQDKYVRYGWNLTVTDLMATGLHRSDLLLHPITSAQRGAIRAVLNSCRLVALKDRRFLSLSYGEKRIALLARALVQAPDWLLLDEFYNGLDGAHRGRMDAILKRARLAGVSWVASAHRAIDVPPGTRGMIELRAGKVHAVRRISRADFARMRAGAAEGEPRRVSLKRGSNGARRSASLPAGGEPLVRIEGASLFVDYRAVLHDIHWELRPGEHWAVLGANGAGKSTFLKLLYGDLSPAYGGKIERADFTKGTSIAVWKRRVGYISPELQADYAHDLTLLDLVASGRYSSVGLCDAPTAADHAVARRWLKFFALLTMAERRPRELSYGQLRRALFARAMAADPRLLLLDEPLTGLDPTQRAAMKRLLAGLMRQRRTLVMAVHRPEDLPAGVTHALHLKDQRASCTTDLQIAT